MEHVSTLCASSTLGIAVSGFALGHAEKTPKQSRFRRKTLSLSLRDHPAVTTDAADTRPPSPKPPQTAQAALSSISNAAGGHADISRWRPSEHLDSPQELPTSATRSRRPRCQTYTSPPLQSTEDQQANVHPRRPSSSWVRRLSAISFQTESRFSTPSPLSPSFNRPASPSLSRPSSQRRPPNKLVKRPPSQHSNALASAPAPTSSVSRRPTTSYQRSEVPRHRPTQSLTFEPSLATHPTPENPETHSPGGNGLWRPLFNSRPYGLPEKLVRRLSAATRQKEQGLRRILPNADAVPTLLLGTSVTNLKPPTNDEWEQSNSSVQFRDPFKPINTAPFHTDTPATVEGRSYANAPSPSLDEGEPGSPATSADTGNIDILGGTALTDVKGSTSSSLADPKPERTTLNLPLRHEKRNIADSNVFRLSGTASQMAFPTTVAPDANGPRRRIISFPLSQDAKRDMGCRRDAIKRPSTADAVISPTSQPPFDRHPDLSSSSHSRQLTKRHSVAASDPASTIVGSDDTRIFTSGEEDETDFLSDTAFDSIRTHMTTNSNSAPHGLRIQSIFDRNPPMDSMNGGPPKLEGLIPRETLSPRQPEKDPLLRDAHGGPFLTTTDSVQKTPDRHPVTGRLFLSTDWSDEDSRSLVTALPGDITQEYFQPSRQNVALTVNECGQTKHDGFSASGTPEVDSVSNARSSQDDGRNRFSEALDTCPKMNIFDWSEQPRNGSENSGASPRPSTVHGKHPNGTRGSRTPGRKAPSALHLRSQSVPTLPEPGLVNETRQTSGKFGTWGLGSKGVSEDWDGDFDFDDADEVAANEDILTDENNNSGRGMVVPKAIMERQDSLHGQFGLVQELTLLVEELKRLRQQATVLEIINGRSSELWKEADGIINLATIDEEDHHSLPRSPSSLTFSFEDSDEDASSTNNPSKRGSGQSWQGSLLERTDSNPQTSPHSRPGDPSPKANSALDMVCQRISQDSTLNNSHVPRTRKLPFDTQSLHELVVRAGVVTRALKDAIRNAEGVTATPGEDSPPSNPPFSRIFERPSHGNLRDLETPCVG